MGFVARVTPNESVAYNTLKLYFITALIGSILAELAYRHLDQTVAFVVLVLGLLVSLRRGLRLAVPTEVSRLVFGPFLLVLLLTVVAMGYHVRSPKLMRAGLSIILFTPLFLWWTSVPKLFALMRGVSAVFCFVVAVGFLSEFRYWLSSSYRLNSPFHNNHIATMATYLVPFLALAPVAAGSVRRRLSEHRLRWLLIAALCVITLLTKSRKCLLVLGVYSGLFVYQPWRAYARLNLRALLLVGVFALGLAPAAPAVYKQFVLAGRKEGDFSTLNDRTIIWAAYMGAIAKHPYIGLGDAAAKVTMRFHPLGKRKATTHAHNFFLAIAAINGIPAAVSFALLMLVSMVVSWVRAHSRRLSETQRRLYTACGMVQISVMIQATVHSETIVPDTIWGAIAWFTVVLALRLPRSLDDAAPELVSHDEGPIAVSGDVATPVDALDTAMA